MLLRPTRSARSVDVLDAAMGLVMAFSSPGTASKGTDLQFMDMVAELNRLLDADWQYLQPCSITYEVQAVLEYSLADH